MATSTKVSNAIGIDASTFSDMADGEALQTHIGTDQQSIDVDDFALGDLGRHSGRHRPLEDLAEAFGTPTLADAGQ